MLNLDADLRQLSIVLALGLTQLTLARLLDWDEALLDVLRYPLIAFVR